MSRSLWPAAAAAFTAMVAVFALKTFADTVILEVYGTRYVPHFFVGQAVATIALSALYGAAIRRATTATDLAAVISMIAAAAAAPLLWNAGGAWPFVAALAVTALSALAAMAAWNAATSVVSGRASRAFIPRIGAAATLGAVVGGFGSSAVVALLGTAWLAPVGAVLGAAIAFLILSLARSRRHDDRRTSSRPARPLAERSARRLVFFLAAAAVVEALLAAVVDLGFKGEVAARFDGEAMALFFALFYGCANGVLLLVQLVVAPRLLATQSLRLTLAAEPLAMAAAAVAWIFVPVLALASLTRGFEMVGKFGLARPAQEVALSPLRERSRQRWKVLLRGVYAQGGAVTGGLLLIAAAPLIADRPVLLPIATAGVAAVWLVLQLKVGRRYLDTLGSALGMLRLSKADRAEVRLDRDGVAAVVELVASERDDLAAFGRELLSQSLTDPTVLAPHLEHRDPRVRAAVYELMERTPDPRQLPALRAAALAEPTDSPAVAAALDALAAHGDPSAIDRARELVGESPPDELPDDAATISAWAYLAAVGALDEDGDALEPVLANLLTSDGARAASLYRSAIQRQRIRGEAADAAIIAAIESDDPRHRSSGLRAAAALGRSKPLVQLLKAIEQNLAGAEESLAAIDGSGLGRLAMLAGARAASSELRLRLVRGLRANPLPAAAEIAARYLRDDDPRVRSVAAHTLARHLRDHGQEVDHELVEAALADELDRFALYVRARWSEGVRHSSMVFRHDTPVASPDIFLVDELERRTERALSQLCAVLALLGNPAKVHAAERALLAPTLRGRNRGVDILQEVARGAHRTRLFELLDRYLSPPRRRDSEALEAVCAADPWLGKCVSRDVRQLQYQLWVLRCTPLFDRVDGEALLGLARQLRDEKVAAGDEVVGPVGLLIVVSGRCEIRGDGAPPGKLGIGQSFGALSLIDGEPPDATLVALSDSRLFRLPRDQFDRARKVDPELGLGLLRGLAASLRKASARRSSVPTEPDQP